MGQASKTKNKKKTKTKYFLIYEKNVYFFRQRNCFVDIWRCYVDAMLRFDLKESSPRNYNLTQNYSKLGIMTMWFLYMKDTLPKILFLIFFTIRILCGHTCALKYWTGIWNKWNPRIVYPPKRSLYPLLVIINLANCTLVQRLIDKN